MMFAWSTVAILSREVMAGPVSTLKENFHLGFEGREFFG